MTEPRAVRSDDAQVSELLAREERLPHTRGSLAIRGFLRALAGAVSWLWVLLVGVVLVNVLLRYALGEGRVEFEEIQWHLYSIGFLLGLSACLDSDDHVRVDVLRARWSLRTQAWVELYGLLVLFFPFVLMVFCFAVPFVAYAFESGEISDAPGGLPLRWLIKAALPLSMALLLLAGWGRLLRVSACLFGVPEPVAVPERSEHGD